MQLKISINSLLFCIAFFIFSIYFEITLTVLDNGNRLLNNLIIIFSIGLLLVKELMEISRYNAIKPYIMGNKLIFEFIFIIISWIVSKNSYGYVLFTSMLFVVAARNVDYISILKTFVFSSGLVLIGVLILNKFGLIASIYSYQGRLRDSLGFSYVSYASQILFYLVCAYVVVRNKKLKIIEILLIMLLNVYVYNSTKTTSPFYLTNIVLLIILLNKYIYKFRKIIASTENFFTGAFIINPIILLWIMFYSPSELYILFDRLTNNRMRLGVEGLRNYGVSLFGQKVDFIVKNSNWVNQYNYIDSSYIQSLVVNGLIFTVCILMLYTYTLYKSTKSKNIFLSTVLIAISIHSMFDPQFIWIWYSPFILLAGKFFKNEEKNVFGIR